MDIKNHQVSIRIRTQQFTKVSEESYRDIRTLSSEQSGRWYRDPGNQ
jgi:hypothetical protein